MLDETRIDSGHWTDWTRRLSAYYSDLLKYGGGAHNRHLHKMSAAVSSGYVADLALFDIDGARILGDPTIVLPLGDEPEFEPEWNDESTEHAVEDEEEQLKADFLAGRDRARSALLRIYKKQKTDPYNRETVIGYPLVSGRVGNKQIDGPLLFWEVEVRYDAGRQRISLNRRSPNPSLNTTLLASFEADEAVTETLKEQLLPILSADQFGQKQLEQTIKIIQGIVGPLQNIEVFKPPESGGWSDFLRHTRNRGAEPGIAYWPVLINGPRTYAFLLEDLENIAKIDEVVGSSVISQVVGGIPEGIGEVDGTRLPFDDTADGGDPLWFPFESNQSQRRVAEAAQRSRILTVQGPPGTGKSLTIANLVCDLVTRGHTVLVTSHQTKALEVVANKLPAIEFLAMAVLRNDRESMAKLKAQLASTNIVANEPADEARKQLQAIEEGLHRHDHELRQLTRRYSELKAIENDGYTDHRHYADIRDLDRISPEDGPFDRAATMLAPALRKWADLVTMVGPALEHLNSLFRPAELNLTRAEEARLADALATLVRLAGNASQRPSSDTGQLLREAKEHEDSISTVANDLRQFGDWLEGPAEAVLRHIRQESKLGTDDWKNWHDRALATPAEEIAVLSDRLGAADAYLRSAEELPALPTRDPYDQPQLDLSVTLLRRIRNSFIKWYFLPSARRARAVIGDAKLPVPSRAAADMDLKRLEQVLRWFRERVKILEVLKQVQSVVPEWRGAGDGLDTVQAMAAAVRSAVRAVQILTDLLAAPLLSTGQAPYPRLVAVLTRDLSPDGRRTASKAARETADRLALQHGAAELKEELRLGEGWRDPVEDLLGALERGDEAPDAMFLRRLAALVRAYPIFQQLVDLETTELSSLPESRAELRERIRRSGELPEWLEDAEIAFEAHRLSSIMRQKLFAHPDDLTAVSERLQEGQTRRRELIEEVIRRKRRLHVRTALTEPRTSVPLGRLNKLLSRTRLTDSLVSLREKIDYQAILNVFPAWICTIDDAARLFPLKPGLFDYLIVDEASQCSQATALPLAYRAKRMIVVGDEHQLQPATARFMRQANIHLLQREHGIVDHPRADALNGRDSLLQLAESCTNHRAFLDEHFRCDPGIIRWSNERFYNNQLRVLTHRRADAFERALEIRELKDADEDCDKKQNVREAEAVVAEARRLIESGEASRMKIGLISPFRDQADLLQTLLLRRFEDRPEWLDEYGLVASTADGFQGDERDIILYSFRYGPSSSPHSITAVQREYQRLNVAFTRAKRKGICFISSPLARFPEGHIRDFLNHARTVENGARTEPDRPDWFDSEFEREVCQRFRDRGLKVTTQEPVGKFRIDLVIEDQEGRVLGVECDGAWKYDDFGQLRAQDYQRQDIIERAGWALHRISGIRYHLNPIAEIDRAMEVLEQQRTIEERRLAIGPTRPSTRPLVDDRADAEQALHDPPVEAEAEQVGPTLVFEKPASTERLVDQQPKTSDGDAVSKRKQRAAPVDPVPAPSVEYAFMRDIGVTPVFAVQGLIRWYMRRNELEGAASDELINILEQMRLEQSLGDDQADYLQKLWQAAVRRGFDPSNDLLLEVR